jgi:hypothetical protein
MAFSLSSFQFLYCVNIYRGAVAHTNLKATSNEFNGYPEK